MRLVVLGGSAASTPELFEAIEAWPDGVERRPELSVALVGRNSAKLELVARASRTRLSRNGASVAIKTATDARAALMNADAVLVQVRIGGLAARSFDESFPWPFGLPGEETMGPGGYANALRTIPALRDTWRLIEEVAPGALVIDLTNPSGMVLQAALRETSLNVLEVCDGPVAFLDGLAARLGRPTDRLMARWVGMNHLGWYVPESPDELPLLADLATGVDPEMITLFGAVPLPYLRYYVHPDRMLAAQRDKPTRASQLQQMETDFLKVYALLGPGEMPRRGAVWYSKVVVPALDAWLNGTERTLLLGVRNGGRLPEVPADAVVELPHRAVRPGIFTALLPVERPPLVERLLAAQGRYEVLGVDAALAGSHEARLRGLLANPMVGSYDQAAGLLGTIEAREAAGKGVRVAEVPGA